MDPEADGIVLVTVGDPATAGSPTGRVSRLSGPLWWALSLGLVAALGLGVVLIVAGSSEEPPAAAPLPTEPFSLAPEAALPSPRAAAAGCGHGEPPSHVLIPALCIDAAVVTTSLDEDGSLVIPADVDRVGRWDGGAGLEPGRRRGTTLLAGHVHYTGQGDGALFRLSEIAPGEVIRTVDERGATASWRAVALQVVHKADLPAEVFAGQRGPRRLVLVTCGGPVEHVPGHGNVYRDNVIVTAVPA